MARTPPPLGGVAFALDLTSCARAGPLLAPISCLARAITPRAPSADRLRGAIGATQNKLQSLSCRGQYGCSVVKGVPPAPDCPCIALASCLARAAHGLTDPHVHALDKLLLAFEPRCRVLSACAPGSRPAQLTAVQVGRAIARPALSKVRPRPPAPHAPRRACAHPRCPSPRAMDHP